MREFFHERGYPRNITQSAMDRVQQISREAALNESIKPANNRVPLVLTYHPQTLPIRNLIRKNFDILQADEDTREIFQEPPVTAFKKDRNLANHLVRASHPSPDPRDSNTCGTFSCNRNRCNTCPYVSLDNFTTILGPKGSFRVNDHFTCISSNVVYAIICTRCKKLYIGETCRRLADRFTEHLRSVKNNFDGFPVARHFNPPSLCTITDIKVTGII